MAINTRTDGDCGYIAMFRGKRAEVYAPSKLEAQQRAARHFKAKKSYEVDVYLAEDRASKPVVHVADF